MTIAPIDYTEALEQQLSLARAMQGPLGEAALGGFGQAINQGYVGAGMRDSNAHGVLAKMIAHAAPFYWCAQLTEVLTLAARTMPEYTFTKSSFPTPNGYVWLEREVPLGSERLSGELMRTEMQLHGGFDPNAETYQTPFKLRAWSWHSVPDHGSVLLFGYIPSIERAAGVPMIQAPVEYGQTLPAAIEGARARGSADAEVYQPSPARIELRNEMHHAFLAVCAASLSFLEQQLVVATPLRVPRASRRRLEREQLRDVEPIVRVVELRTPHYSHPDTQAPLSAEDAAAEAAVHGPDWHYRWFVRGHWRRQWFQKSEVHKPLWIAAYVKGPDGLPLKSPATTIYAVRR